MPDAPQTGGQAPAQPAAAPAPTTLQPARVQVQPLPVQPPTPPRQFPMSPAQPVPRPQGQQPAAAPAQAPAQPAGQQPAQNGQPSGAVLKDDAALVEVKIKGQTRFEPLSKVRETYQIGEATREELDRARALRERYEGRIQFTEQMENLLATNPARAMQEFERLARARGYQPAPAAPQHQNTPPADPLAAMYPELADPRAPQGSPAPGPNQARDPEVAQLKAMVDELMGKERQKAAAESIENALRPYALYQNDQHAADQAKTVLAALKMVHPNRSIEDLASELHASDFQRHQQYTQGVYDQRVQTAAAHAAIPPSMGTPATTDLPPPTYADIGNGNLRERMKAFVDRMHPRSSL